MSTTMKELGIDRLEPAERIAPALEIWESLGENRPVGQLTTEQQAELTRRDAELNANPEIGLTWEQIRASVEAKTQLKHDCRLGLAQSAIRGDRQLSEPQ